MIIVDVRQKLLIFMDDKKLTQMETAVELGISYQYFNNFMNNRYEMSYKLEIRIRNLFRRYGYNQALDIKGEL